MLGSPYFPWGDRTPKEERKKEETGGEERAPTEAALMEVSAN